MLQDLDIRSFKSVIGNEHTLSQIAEAFQHLTLLLSSKVAKESSELEQANQTINKLQASNKSLLVNDRKMKHLLDESAQRAEFYKRKFLKIQDELIQMHRANKKLTKTFSANVQKQAGFPFAVESDAVEVVQPLVLAPDTCFNDDQKSEYKENKLGNPPKNMSLYEIIKSKRDAVTRGVGGVDPDETRLDRRPCSEDEEEFSIPASPVLSNKLAAIRRQDSSCRNDEFVDGTGSPSLLSSLQNVKDPQTKLLFKKTPSVNAVDTADDHKLVQKYWQENESLAEGEKSISPIKIEGNSRCAATEESMDTSLDELFNRTDGVLMKSHLDNISAGVDRLNKAEVEEENVQKQMECPIINSGKNKANTSQKENTNPNAKACRSCEAYYRDFPANDREEAMRGMCRHRFKSPPPPATPHHFWEIGIPSTAECRKRGYIRDEKDLSPKAGQESGFRRRRRKPYQAHFPT